MQKIRIRSIKKRATVLLVFFISLFICVGVTYAYVRNKIDMQSAQMEHLALTKAGKVSNVLSKLLYKTQALSALVIQSNGDVKDFERVSATILDDPAVENLILAPSGIVSKVYPLESNEAVIGLDYFSEHAGNLEAIQARDSGQLVLGGPFTTVQGRQSLVGRLPIHLTDASGNRYFWGMVSVTLKYPEALAGAELDQLKEQGFAYEIWRVNPDTNERQIISHSDYQYGANAQYVEEPLNILNASWYFRISPIRNWYQIPETWIFLAVGIFVSTLLAFLVRYNDDLRQIQKSLEELSYRDVLTDVFNRRGVFRLVEDMVGHSHNRFVLCYIDLDNFKSINDTYGHSTGDRVLRLLSDEFRGRMADSDVLGRIGGDEFVLVFDGTADDIRLTQMLDDVRAALCSSELGQRFPISFSVGCVAYPDQGGTLDELISLADAQMYHQKMDTATEKRPV